MSAERRKRYRVEPSGEERLELAVLRLPGQEPVEAQLVDLSYGGVGFIVAEADLLKRGDKLSVTLTSVSGNMGPLRASVQSVRPGAQGYRIGTRIVWSAKALQVFKALPGAATLLNRRGAYRVTPPLGKAPAVTVYLSKGADPISALVRDVSLTGISLSFRGREEKAFRVGRNYGLVVTLGEAGQFTTLARCIHRFKTARHLVVGFKYASRKARVIREREDVIMRYMMDLSR